MSTASKGLNQIYNALDNHQYSRAIKLCQQVLQAAAATAATAISNVSGDAAAAQYSSHAATNSAQLLVLALLAHAYSKSSQRYKALLTIHQIFSYDPTVFPELQLELRIAALLEESSADSSSFTAATSNTAASPSKASSSSSSTAASSSSAAAPLHAQSASVASGKKAASKKGKKKSTPQTAATEGTASNSIPKPSSAAVATSDAASSTSWDWIDQLDTVPTLPADWEQRIPSKDAASTTIPLSPTLLATLSMTMTQVLKLPLTAYQLYTWAMTVTITTPSSPDDKALYTQQAYLNGLALLLAPQYASIHATVLQQLQGLALQVAKWRHDTTYVATAAALWPAQTALWQMAWPSLTASAAATTTSSMRTNNNQISTSTATTDENAAKQEQRLALLPRLAESLAYKCVTEYCRRDDAGIDGMTTTGAATSTVNEAEHNFYIDTEVTNGSLNGSTNGAGGAGVGPTSSFTLLATESLLLYVRTLELQGKWEEQVQVLNDYSRLLPKQTMAELKLQALSHLPGRDGERRDILQDLLSLYPDDWDYWKQYLQASMAQAGGEVEEGCQLTEAYVTTILQQDSSPGGGGGGGGSNGEYPLRGPRLMLVELALCRMKMTHGSSGIGDGNDEAAPLTSSTANVDALVDSMILYGNEFGERASCIFSDLRPYLRECLPVCHVEHVDKLLHWTKDLRSVAPTSTDPKVRRRQLRRYIFAVQVTFQILAFRLELWDRELPSWEELVRIWKDFREFELSENVDQAQKESRPADELILLAVQRLLCREPGVQERMTAVCLLESAMRNSPYNPYLKISALFIYGDLHASARSSELYSELSVKHIQNETCSYLILPILRSGGLYRETISVCQDIIVLQRAAGRDVAEYTARAMENGAISKADEFVTFHKKRMLTSLTSIEAKGLILDAAPMIVQDEDGMLGAAHGIVGGDTDMDRVRQMAAEAHNPFGAFTVLQLCGPAEELIEHVAVNRDLSILSYEILTQREFDSPEQILHESIQRGHHHNILIRAALVIDASKGPKKGKATKSSTELEKRCKSLLQSAHSAAQSKESIRHAQEYALFLQAMIELCFAIVALSSGFNGAGDVAFETLDLREEAMLTALQNARSGVQSAHDSISNRNEMTTAKVSRLLPDCIAPLFALFQMSAKLADLYGWGRRRRKTKRCADAIANLALSFSQLVHLIRLTVTCAPTQLSYPELALDADQAIVVDESLFDATNNVVIGAQRVTQLRIESILNYVYDTLNAYNIDE